MCFSCKYAFVSLLVTSTSEKQKTGDEKLEALSTKIAAADQGSKTWLFVVFFLSFTTICQKQS